MEEEKGLRIFRPVRFTVFEFVLLMALWTVSCFTAGCFIGYILKPNLNIESFTRTFEDDYTPSNQIDTKKEKGKK